MTIFTGASAGLDRTYVDAAATFARQLVAARIGVVHGGGRVGLMGVVADAVLDAGGEIIGVMPRDLVDREIAHPGLSRLEIVDSLHERKARMAALGDVFVALPGGAGTLDEWFEAWTWGQLGLHDKPVALLDVGGFWGPLLDLLDHLVRAGFIARGHRDAVIVARDAHDLIRRVEGWSPAGARWTDPP